MGRKRLTALECWVADMPVRYAQAAAVALRFIIESVNPGCARRSLLENLRHVSSVLPARRGAWLAKRLQQGKMLAER